jgi:hypothetical protein
MSDVVFVPAQLNDLGLDVALISPSMGDLFVRGESKWINQSPGNSGAIYTSNGPGQLPTWEPIDLSIYDNHISDTDNPHNVTASQIGLGNVENTVLSTWPGTSNVTTLGTIGTGVWNATAVSWTKVNKTGSSLADLESHNFSLLSAIPTTIAGYGITDAYTKGEVDSALATSVSNSIADIIGSAPEALNTLEELANAFGNDADFSVTVVNLLAGKEPTINAGTTSQYWRGDKSWQTLDKAAVGLSNVENAAASGLYLPLAGGTVTGLFATSGASSGATFSTAHGFGAFNDVLTWQCGTGARGRLYAGGTGSTQCGVFNGAQAAGEGVLFDSSTNTLTIRTGTSSRATFSSAGFIPSVQTKSTFTGHASDADLSASFLSQASSTDLINHSHFRAKNSAGTLIFDVDKTGLVQSEGISLGATSFGGRWKLQLGTAGTPDSVEILGSFGNGIIFDQVNGEFSSRIGNGNLGSSTRKWGTLNSLKAIFSQTGHASDADLGAAIFVQPSATSLTNNDVIRAKTAAGTLVFNVDKTGITTSNTKFFTRGVGNAGGYWMYDSGGNANGALYLDSSNNLVLASGGNALVKWTGTFDLGSQKFNNSSAVISWNDDIGIARNAAGLLEINTSVKGTLAGLTAASATLSGQLTASNGTTAAPSITSAGGGGFRFNASLGDVGIIVNNFGTSMAVARFHVSSACLVGQVNLGATGLDPYGTSPNVGFRCSASGFIEVNDGATIGNYRDLGLRTLTASGQVKVPVGTVSLPSLANSTDPSTGIQIPAGNATGVSCQFVCAGGELGRILNNGDGFRLTNNIKLSWSSGASNAVAADTFLYRSAVNTLKTNGQFTSDYTGHASVESTGALFLAKPSTSPLTNADLFRGELYSGSTGIFRVLKTGDTYLFDPVVSSSELRLQFPSISTSNPKIQFYSVGDGRRSWRMELNNQYGLTAETLAFTQYQGSPIFSMFLSNISTNQGCHAFTMGIGSDGVGGGIGVFVAGIDTTLHVRPVSASSVGIKETLRSSQTANAYELYSSGGTLLNRINKDGYSIIRKTAAPADADLNASELAIWWDDTIGATGVKYKGKDSAGTVVSGTLS